MRKSRFTRPRSAIAALVAICAVILLTAMPSSGVTRGSHVTQTAQGGFGDFNNSYAWSMAWFKGKLYVGTGRDQQCVENATRDFYFPGKGYYPGDNSDINVTCPPDKNDLDLRAEIWQYTPTTNSWVRVYQSPADIPNPDESGKFLARDMGFRGMVVYNNQLYVGDNTPDEMYPAIAALNPPRILRSADGVNWTPVNGSPGPVNNPFGTQTPIGFRAMVVYQNRMFVTVISGLTGDGVVEEVHNPAGPTTTFTQVSPSNLDIFEMQVFANHLYIGTGDSKLGYGVYRTNAIGAVPYKFTPVITNGAGRGAGITSVVSMGVFQNKLYVGSSGWYNSVLPASEEIRIAPTGRWDLVAGRARQTTQGYKKPISGLPDGFGNPFNAHFWRQTGFRNAYFLGTNDWSYAWGNFPVIGPLLRPGYGFDLWGTCDGKYWWAETSNAFGDSQYNFGARTLAATPYGFMIGSANQSQGTSVFRDTYLRPCRTASTKKNDTVAPGTTTPIPPDALTSTAATGGTSLTWAGSDGAASYQILRASYVTTDAVNAVKPPTVDGMQLGELPDPTLANTTAPVSVPTAFTQIGTSTTASFLDTTATPGANYLYEVVAVGSDGSASLPSNVTGAPLS